MSFKLNNQENMSGSKGRKKKKSSVFEHTEELAKKNLWQQSTEQGQRQASFVHSVRTNGLRSTTA